MYVYVFIWYDVTSPAVAGSTGRVKVSSNPSGFARISRISNGTLPVQTSRSMANGLVPREPHPRLVPPTNMDPSRPNRTGTHPEPSPLRNGKHAPWYRPFTFSRNTRITVLCVWSPTKSCFSNGPNFPADRSQSIPAADWPIFPYGKITHVGVSSGIFLASVIIRLPLFGTAGAA